MRTIGRVLLVTAACAAAAAHAGATRVITPLPAYPPAVDVYDQNGNSLTPRRAPQLEFATLSLHEQPAFRPTDERHAACELSAMVPEDFEARLLEVRLELIRLWSTPSDPAVGERVLDLALHLDGTWGRKWSPIADPVERLAKLMTLLSQRGCE